MLSLKRAQESYQRITVFFGHVLEEILRSLALAAMPHDCLDKIAGTTIVEEVSMSVHHFLQTYPPQRGSAPLIAACQAADVIVVQSHIHDFAAHVVQQEIRIRMDGLAALPGELRAVEQGRTAGTGLQGDGVAEVALGLVEHLLATLHLWIVDIAARRYTE